ncbi:MAG: o-succinylbenzoate synthase [Actinomycetota bacterium]|nr:o-succinylbenzoate synthase [Actinomycetota bacterium]
MSQILEGLELHPVRIPMRHRFRRIDSRDALLIRGPAGWGEFSPFAEYSPEVTKRWLAAALELARAPLPVPLREEVPVNVTIPAIDPVAAADLVVRSGATTAKVKIGEPGHSADDDDARVRAVREALGAGGNVRVDVNAAWDVETAVERLQRLSRFDLQYAEQPVGSVDEMVQLKKRVSVPLAADEVVRLGEDPLEIADRGGADVLIVKVQPMGGIEAVLDLARRSPLPVVVSSALETSVGMYGGVHAAASLPDLDYACGLGTVTLLDGDPTREPLIPTKGWLEVRRPEPSPDLLERWRPDADTAAEMLRRVSSAAEMLA